MTKWIPVKCASCGKEFNLSAPTYNKHRRNGSPIRCVSCTSSINNKKNWDNPDYREKISNARKSMWSNMTAKERETQLSALQNGHNMWSNNLTDEEKRKIAKKLGESNKLAWNDPESKNRRSKDAAERNRLRYENMSEDEKADWKRKLLDGQQKYWEDMSDEERLKISEERRKQTSERWDNMTPEQKKEWSIRTMNQMANMSEEEKLYLAEKRRQTWANKSAEEMSTISEKQSESHKKFWDGVSDEYRASWSDMVKGVWSNMAVDKRNALIDRLMTVRYNWYSKLDDQSRMQLVRKQISGSNRNNRLHNKFVRNLNESIVSDNCYPIPEQVMIGSVIHSWDYGIFDENGELVMVVDLDGTFYHADNCDYDGIHSKLEYDEKRWLSIPDGVKHCIIYEERFDESFDYMKKLMKLSYDEYIDYRVKLLQSMPFPQPHYTDQELLRSYDKLTHMKPSDKYHKDLSLNTRLGDRLIQHFHISMFGELQRLWNDANWLREHTKSNQIYHNHINQNKLLVGFHWSMISPGWVRMVFDRYCNYGSIVDPSGNPSILLAAIASDKSYSGPISVESERMVSFLAKNAIDIKLSDAGECLVTMVDTADDMEYWMNVQRCRKYVFISFNKLDDTFECIPTRSYFGNDIFIASRE